MTASVSVEESAPETLKHIANGICLAGDRYHIDLVGGDTTHGAETVITVQVTGEVKRNNVLTRSGAQTGDYIFVSGYPGDAAAGLSILQSATPGDRVWAKNDYLVRRFANPDARIGLGRAIAGIASAAIDLSDGLYADLAKMLDASGVGGVLDVDRIPLSDEILQTMDGDDALNIALSGGDDYELCFTSSDKSVVRIGKKLGVPVTRIGKVKKKGGLRCTKDGEPFDFEHAGYRHF